MSDRSDMPATITELLSEIKQTQDHIARADAERVRKIKSKAEKSELTKIADEMARKCGQLQNAVDRLSIRVGRPSGSALGDFSADAEAAAARGLLEMKHLLRGRRRRGSTPAIAAS